MNNLAQFINPYQGSFQGRPQVINTKKIKSSYSFQENRRFSEYYSPFFNEYFKPLSVLLYQLPTDIIQRRRLNS